jgi:hypothetical protein
MPNQAYEDFEQWWDKVGWNSDLKLSEKELCELAWRAGYNAAGLKILADKSS